MAAARVFVIGAVAAVAATVFMARKDPTDHYAALGVDRRASKDEIRAAYKQAALRFHPDKCASKRGLWHALLGGAARCARRFHAASAAEEVLSDDAKRELCVQDMVARRCTTCSTWSRRCCLLIS